jgi:hypothetical protein
MGGGSPPPAWHLFGAEQLPFSIPILRSGALAEAFCRSVARAKVEAVFDRSLYLRHGDDFICVGDPTIGNGPLTLIADTGVSHLVLKPGDAAAVCARQITIGHAVAFTLERSEVWRPPPWPAYAPPARLIEACAALARCAAIAAPPEGFARLAFGAPGIAGPLARVARTRIAAFESWLSGVLEAGHAAAGAPVQGLIGLGPGLTPSGDDFLSGVLMLLGAIGERDAHAALARAIAAAAPGSTSALSACFLRATAAGHVGENLHRAVSSIVTGDVDAAVAAVANIGHSSGWDLLAGVASTLRIAAAGRMALSE